MAYRRLLLQIFLSFLTITLIALFSITWYSGDLVRSFFLKETHQNLKNVANLLTEQVVSHIENKNYEQLAAIITRLGATTDTRITVILSDGLVVADSEKDPQKMDNHARRPEIIEALSGKIGTSQRYSDTVNQNFLYVAVPLKRDDQIFAVLRTAFPLNAIEETLLSFQKQIIIAGIFLAILTVIIGWVISRKISAPYEQITNGIERIANGELSFRLQLPNKGMEKLVNALNAMVSQLEEKIKTIDQQSRELNAVLQSMVEGVIAVDHNKKILTMNKAAHKLLGLNSEEVVGRKIKEIVQIKQLRKIITNALKTNELIEEEIIIPPDDRYVQIHGSILVNEEGKTIGALVVLNDVTRLRRLEAVRRDFVANVSHEIRTPLTSIKGFVETLRDGAMNEPETAKHFLDIMSTQSNRLNMIIEDLLTLASLEENEERASIQFEDVDLKGVIRSAMEICQPTADAKHITLNVNCPDGVRIRMNPSLIEQALVNLIENAVKYSPDNTQVYINCLTDEQGHTIEVRDEGIGIENEQLPRIFERFYRVDKARSRKMGGTGLGLSIVKHIAKVHYGKVNVESTVGKGSTFRFFIPKLGLSDQLASSS